MDKEIDMSEEKNQEAIVFKPLEQEMLQTCLEELGVMTSTIVRLKGFEHALRVALTCISRVLMGFDFQVEWMTAYDFLSFGTNPDRADQADWLNQKIRYMIFLMPMTENKLAELIDTENAKPDDEEAALIASQMIEKAVEIDARLHYMRQGIDIKYILEEPELKEVLQRQIHEIKESIPEDMDECLDYFKTVLSRLGSDLIFLATKDINFCGEDDSDKEENDPVRLHSLYLSTSVYTLRLTEPLLICMLVSKEDPNYQPGNEVSEETRERVLAEQYQKAVDYILESNLRHEAGRYLDGKIDIEVLSQAVQQEKSYISFFKALAWIEYYRERENEKKQNKGKQ